MDTEWHFHFIVFLPFLAKMGSQSLDLEVSQDWPVKIADVLPAALLEIGGWELSPFFQAKFLSNIPVHRGD